jgi:Mono-functional DNA-alkylating methyl methanesulfonate N-term
MRTFALPSASTEQRKAPWCAACLDAARCNAAPAVQVFQPAGRVTDALFMLTERRVWFVLAWDAERGRLQTLASGDAIEPIGRPVENTPIAAVDPHNRCIAIHCYSGVLRIVALSANAAGATKHFTVRMEDLSVLDMQWEALPASEPPMLIVLHQDMATLTRRRAPAGARRTAGQLRCSARAIAMRGLPFAHPMLCNGASS